MKMPVPYEPKRVNRFILRFLSLVFHQVPIQTVNMVHSHLMFVNLPIPIHHRL